MSTARGYGALLAVLGSATLGCGDPGLDDFDTCERGAVAIVVAEERLPLILGVSASGACDAVCRCDARTWCPCGVPPTPEDGQSEMAVLPRGAGECTIRIDIDYGTGPLETVTTFGRTEGCCEDTCIASGATQICIGPVEDESSCSDSLP